MRRAFDPVPAIRTIPPASAAVARVPTVSLHTWRWSHSICPLFFLFPFNFFPFSENCHIQFALRILSQFSPYSDLQDPDSLRQCWRPELHLFLLFHNRSSSDQDLSKGRRRNCVKIEFLKLEMNYDANVYTISVYNNGIFQSFQFSVFTFQASSWIGFGKITMMWIDKKCDKGSVINK